MEPYFYKWLNIKSSTPLDLLSSYKPQQISNGGTKHNMLQFNQLANKNISYIVHKLLEFNMNLVLEFDMNSAKY